MQWPGRQGEWGRGVGGQWLRLVTTRHRPARVAGATPVEREREEKSPHDPCIEETKGEQIISTQSTLKIL